MFTSWAGNVACNQLRGAAASLGCLAKLRTQLHDVYDAATSEVSELATKISALAKELAELEGGFGERQAELKKLGETLLDRVTQLCISAAKVYPEFVKEDNADLDTTPRKFIEELCKEGKVRCTATPNTPCSSSSLQSSQPSYLLQTSASVPS